MNTPAIIVMLRLVWPTLQACRKRTKTSSFYKTAMITDLHFLMFDLTVSHSDIYFFTSLDSFPFGIVEAEVTANIVHIRLHNQRHHSRVWLFIRNINLGRWFPWNFRYTVTILKVPIYQDDVIFSNKRIVSYKRRSRISEEAPSR